MSPFLTYDEVLFLNLPGAEHTLNEMFVEDCYRRAFVPSGSMVLDVGGHYGEFGLWCAVRRDCAVFIYEPSPLAEVCECNARLNNVYPSIHRWAIADKWSHRPFTFLPEETFKSRLGGTVNEVQCVTLLSQIERARLVNDGPVVVKLDCEGAEREIFDDESWLQHVRLLMLEFHNKDGPRYREILQRHGFTLDTNDPNPEAIRATIYAKRD